MPDDITIVAGRGERKPPYNFKEIPLTREYTASLNAIFAITTADLLQEGWTSIRWCKREKCGKPFYPVRRQSYCSPQCSQLVRSAKHAEGDKDKKEGKTG